MYEYTEQKKTGSSKVPFLIKKLTKKHSGCETLRTLCFKRDIWFDIVWEINVSFLYTAVHHSITPP